MVLGLAEIEIAADPVFEPVQSGAIEARGSEMFVQKGDGPAADDRERAAKLLLQAGQCVRQVGSDPHVTRPFDDVHQRSIEIQEKGPLVVGVVGQSCLQIFVLLRSIVTALPRIYGAKPRLQRRSADLVSVSGVWKPRRLSSAPAWGLARLDGRHKRPSFELRETRESFVVRTRTGARAYMGKL